MAKFGREEVVQGGTTRQGGESNKHPIHSESKNRHPTTVEEVFIALFTLNLLIQKQTQQHKRREASFLSRHTHRVEGAGFPKDKPLYSIFYDLST